MNIGRGTLKGLWRRVGQGSASQLAGLFGEWVNLEEDLGQAKRARLFSPHRNLLAVPVSGSMRRCLLQGGAQKIPRLAGSRGGEDRVFQYRSILQGAGKIEGKMPCKDQRQGGAKHGRKRDR